MSIQISAEHGVVCRVPDSDFGYFGWPSVARLGDGTLVAGASGLRQSHVCPWGKSVLCFSRDDGRTWSAPRVVHDSPLDDRDVGLVALGGQALLLTWFSIDPRQYLEAFRRDMRDAQTRSWMEARVSALTDETVFLHSGSWTRLSLDGGETFTPPRRCPVTAPHGPIVLADGRLLYAGKRFPATRGRTRMTDVAVVESADRGETWTEISVVPLPPGFAFGSVHEPHLACLPDGTMLCALRVEEPDTEATWMSRSADGGRTWSEPYRLPCDGTPPHLLRHSSGTLICAYGYRHAPDGQRALLSRDGQTWDEDCILRDDGLDGDLGYPCSVELADGSIFTVYYQRLPGDRKTSVLWTRWRLPRLP